MQSPRATSSFRVSKVLAGMLVSAVVAALVGALVLATDFIGDDHVFLAWARYAASPWGAFVHDAHGGEYYRPLAFLWWWCLGRAFGFEAAPFAIFMAIAHALAASLTGGLLRRAGEPRAVAWGAAAVFFVSPAQLDAVSWYAASTDLLAGLALLAALWAFLARRRLRGLVCGAACIALALLCKESAAMFPFIIVVWRFGLRAGAAPGAARGQPVEAAPARRPASLAAWSLSVSPLLAGYLLWRRHVLQGWGGAGDPLPPLGSRVVGALAALPMWLSGAPAGVEPVLAVLLGAALAIALLVNVRLQIHARLPSLTTQERATEDVSHPARPPARFTPFVLLALALAPLLAVAEPTAHRYTYVAGFPLSWLVSRALFARGARRFGVLVLAWFAISATAQLVERAGEVGRYRRRLEAARVAVAEGLAAGHRLFHVANGIKDLDLAVKEDAVLQPRHDELLVLCDVPASFAYRDAVPDPTLLAHPPLPPSGAYRFGAVRIAGLSRRGDEPTLEEAFGRWPDLRLLRPCSPQRGDEASLSPEKLCDVTDALRP